MKIIANQDLVLSDIPAPDADLADIFAFAMTFNGYKEYGSFAGCSSVALSDDVSTLSALRARLFFHQRTAHHMSAWTSYEEHKGALSALIEAIRVKVVADEIE